MNQHSPTVTTHSHIRPKENDWTLSLHASIGVQIDCAGSGWMRRNYASCRTKLDSVAVASGHHNCGKAKQRNAACQKHNQHKAIQHQKRQLSLSLRATGLTEILVQQRNSLSIFNVSKKYISSHKQLLLTQRNCHKAFFFPEHENWYGSPWYG